MQHEVFSETTFVLVSMAYKPDPLQDIHLTMFQIKALPLSRH